MGTKKIYFVIGGPGCGKGTQCDKIKEDYSLMHVSTGDLIRQEIQKGSKVGKEVEKLVSKGKLVSSKTILQLLKNFINENSAATGFLIDGFPRELSQAKNFEKSVAPVTKVLHFKVSDETMKARLLARAASSGRADDTEAVIVDRIKTHNNNIKPILSYFEKSKKLSDISAEGDVDEVYELTKQVMDN